MNSLYGLTYIKVDNSNLDIAYKIQKEEWPEDPDYNDLYDKAVNTKEDNVEFIVYNDKTIVGITGVDVFDKYKNTIWLNWFTILPEHRRKGYGKKVLEDTIEYCKKMNKYKYFRVDTTYYENRPALFLYDKVMEIKEEYTCEDTDTNKNNFLIYTTGLNCEAKPWNNKYLGLKEYYDKCK